MRNDNRAADCLRRVEITRGYTRAAAGSVLIRFGRTTVLCTASIVEGVPEWRVASGKGWLTAEYDMLPGSTPQRKARSRDRLDGRTQEIQRLIGRSCRCVVDLSKLGSNTLQLDCDVLEADGGTRTAAITGVFVALADALDEGRRRGLWADGSLLGAVAAISAGYVRGELLLDLNYEEDSAAEVDCNLVRTGRGEWIEVQSTAERRTFSDAQLTEMMAVGRRGIDQLLALQETARRAPLGETVSG